MFWQPGKSSTQYIEEFSDAVFVLKSVAEAFLPIDGI